MKTGTKFKKFFYETLEEFQCEDDVSFDSYENDRIGVYAGSFDHDLFYAIDRETLLPREALTVIFPTSVPYRETTVISGFPLDCFYRLNGKIGLTDEGSITIVDPLEPLTLVFVGKYKHATLIIPLSNSLKDGRDADNKWQALMNATPSQIDNWMNSNITDLASARSLLRTLVYAVRYLSDKVK